MGLRQNCMSRTKLCALAMAVLKAAGTDAGQSIYAPRDWPTDVSMFPALAVQAPTERKESQRRGGREFFTTITLAVMVRVSSDSGGDTEAALERLCSQVEDTVLSSIEFTQAVQQFSRIETTMVIDVESENTVGEAVILFDCEVYQTYDPARSEPLLSVRGTVPSPGGGVPLLDPTISLST